ncbi:MAG: hypothetical protein RR382_03495 [Tannerellaceae bacterium]
MSLERTDYNIATLTKRAYDLALQAYGLAPTWSALSKRAAKTLDIGILLWLPMQLEAMHLKATDPGQHLALNGVGDDLEMDQFIECLIAEYGRDSLKATQHEIEFPDQSDYSSYVRGLLEKFKKATEVMCKSDSAFNSLRDDRINTLRSLIYKLDQNYIKS